MDPENIGQSEPSSSPESSGESYSPQVSGGESTSSSSPNPSASQSSPQQYVATPDQRNGAQSGYGTSPASVNAPPQQPQQPPQQQQYTVREAAARYGYDSSGYANDAEAIRDLVSKAQQSQQLQQMAQYGNQYLQHAGDFNNWLKEKQAAEAAKAAPAQESWWKAPEFDPEWRSKVVRDSNGNLTTLPGAPPDLINKYSSAIEHRDKFLEQFAFDPVGAIKPGIEEVAKGLIEKILGERDSQQQVQTFAKDYISQNSSWLHQRDQQGKIVYDQNTGKPALAPYGKAFAHYVQQAAATGISNENQRASYAASMVQRDYLKHQAQREAQQNAHYRDYYNQAQIHIQQAKAQQAQQVAQQAQGQQQKQQFVQQAPARQGNALSRIGNADAAALSSSGAVKNKALNLAQRMRQSLDANGVSEGSFNRSR